MGQNFLFVSLNLTRDMVRFANALHERGENVAIAAPAGPESRYLRDVKFTKIPQIKLFAKNLFIHLGMNFHGAQVVALDTAAADWLKQIKVPHTLYPMPPVINARTMHSTAVSPHLQTRFLSGLNIPPHKKMITVIGNPAHRLNELVAAAETLARDDFVIALFGNTRRADAHKIMQTARENGKIIPIHHDTDPAVVLRSGFAIMSLGAEFAPYSDALASGRPLVWAADSSEIRPNIKITKSIADALQAALNLTDAERSEMQATNERAAKKYDLDRAARDFLILNS